MKHAYLIIAHGEYNLLNILVNMIDDVRNDIFIHIDKKSPPRMYYGGKVKYLLCG